MALKFETLTVVNFGYYDWDFNIGNFWPEWAKHGPKNEANYGLKKVRGLNNTTKAKICVYAKHNNKPLTNGPKIGIGQQRTNKRPNECDR